MHAVVAEVEQHRRELAALESARDVHGLGLGLPGARRLMDEFAIMTEIGRGTTVTMTKWRAER